MQRSMLSKHHHEQKRKEAKIFLFPRVANNLFAQHAKCVLYVGVKKNYGIFQLYCLCF